MEDPIIREAEKKVFQVLKRLEDQGYIVRNVFLDTDIGDDRLSHVSMVTIWTDGRPE